MRKIGYILVIFCSVIRAEMTLPELRTKEDIRKFLSVDEKTIGERAKEALAVINSEFQDLFAEGRKETFETSIYALDRIIGKMQAAQSFYEGIGLVHPDKAVREGCEAAQRELHSAFLKAFFEKPELYLMVQNISEDRGNFSIDQAYYVDELVNELRAQGMHLSVEDKQKVVQLQSELADLGLQFQKNIREDGRSLFVGLEELEGLDDYFIGQLNKNEEGLYELTCDYPVYFSILKHCTKANTRKKMECLFTNRAYPANIAVLNAMIEKRDQLAHMLGFGSFAEYDVNQQMAKKVDRVDEFLRDLVVRSKNKADREFKEITEELPEGVILTKEGKLRSYDIAFVVEQYRKRAFSLDERQVSEYFPLEKVLQGMICVYETFFSLKITEWKEAGLWDPTARLFSIQEQETGRVQGYVVFDFFPRENKYTHACECTLIPSYSDERTAYPALSLVVTNFQTPSLSRDSLLTHGEVRTLFHEFGHAMHDLLGRGQFMAKTGTKVKRDFVEFPSQLLEEWVWEPEILRKISFHYETGAPLPDDIIAFITRAKNSTAGLELQRQCLLSLFALACFSKDTKKDPIEKLQELRELIQDKYAYQKENRFHLSFGHLDGYGATYYGYTWAKVFAVDAFARIKKEGILCPKVGGSYVQTILHPGGTQDPNQMLEKFLGRKPSIDCFIQSLGDPPSSKQQL